LAIRLNGANGMKELIESRQIRAFVAVARRGNFTHGAKDVFLTQSAVSHAIKSLEEDVGVSLFQRVGRRAVLTQAGERLLQHCEEILDKMQHARMDLSQMPDLERQCLRIGAPMTVCQHILPSVLRKVRHEYPQCGLRVDTGDNPQLLAQLLSGRIDLAIMVEPEKRPDLVYESLFRDEMRFVMLPEHPWAKLPTIPATAIAESTLIMANKATRTYGLVTAYFRAARIPLQRCIELGSIESIKELVKNGLGVGVVAEWPIQAELERGELVSRPFGHRSLLRQWQAVHLRHRALSALEADVIRLSRENRADLAAKAAATSREKRSDKAKPSEPRALLAAVS
jgi:DNA-binding transcriptional LysR family regulator